MLEDRLAALRQWLLPDAADDTAAEVITTPAAMARLLGLLYLAGATLGLASMVLAQPPGTDVLGIYVVLACAFTVAAGLLAGRRRLSTGVPSLALACGTVMITLGIDFTGQSQSVYAIFYIWVGFAAFFFLSSRQAVAHVGWVGVAYAAVLTVQHTPHAAERWMITVGTVLVAGLLVAMFRRRSERLLARLSQAVARLGAAARTDPLTELLNRRGFHELMELELERAHRSQRPLSLLVADLDRFKDVNDRFGHLAGDRVLERFARVLSATRRRIEQAARIGGEEFAIVVPEDDKHGAYILAERLRREVRETFADCDTPLSVSFGVASFPEDGTTVEALMHAGDRALYAAKELGRDRSVIYSADIVGRLLSEADSRDQRTASHLTAVLLLAETLDMRDSGTAQHSVTVGRHAMAIARELGLAPERIARVHLAGNLHDIGKIGVADSILQKPGPLGEEEWLEMRRHCELGARILAGANLDDISGWVLGHHERPDGGGYPQGLQDGEIPLEAKILAVADAYEAMTSDRIYRAALGLDAAAQELRRCAGTQFDARVVEALLRAVATTHVVA